MESASAGVGRFHNVPRLFHHALKAARSRCAQSVKLASQRKPERRSTKRITRIRMPRTIHFKMEARLLKKLPTELDGGACSLSRLDPPLPSSFFASWFLPPEFFSFASLSFFSLDSGSCSLPLESAPPFLSSGSFPLALDLASDFLSGPWPFSSFTFPLMLAPFSSLVALLPLPTWARRDVLRSREPSPVHSRSGYGAPGCGKSAPKPSTRMIKVPPRTNQAMVIPAGMRNFLCRRYRRSPRKLVASSKPRPLPT